MRLDSPGSLSHDYPGDRSDAHDTLPPTLLYTADTSGMPRTSVSEIINALNGIWSVRARSEEEGFLIRIEEERELFPVSNADLFHCLPFFLSDTTLFWYRSRRSDW